MKPNANDRTSTQLGENFIAVCARETRVGDRAQRLRHRADKNAIKATPSATSRAAKATRAAKTPRAIAAALSGALLLIGTGATFALWSDEARLQEERIPLGQLSVRADALSWVDVSDIVPSAQAEQGESSSNGATTDDAAAAPAPKQIADINAFVLVPGDTLEATGAIASTLVGETLTADLSLGTFTPLPEWVSHSISFLDDAGAPITDADGHPVTSIPQSESGTVNVRVSLSWDDAGAPHLLHRQDQLHLSNLQVNLQQVLTD